jgi:hypothetical protein
VSPAPRPDVPRLLARLVATDPADPDTGIGLWVWQDEAACRAYEAARPVEIQATLARELDETDLVERTFDALFFGCRAPQPGADPGQAADLAGQASGIPRVVPI